MAKNVRHIGISRNVFGSLIMHPNKDTGLSKKGLQEVQNIVSESIQTLKDDFDKRFDDMKSDNEKRWDNMSEFKTKVYKHLETIQKSLVTIKFQHDWKTAFWVFIGSATPVSIGIIFFFLKAN